MMAIVAATHHIANCYYNQPASRTHPPRPGYYRQQPHHRHYPDKLRAGPTFIPLGDMLSRKKLILAQYDHCCIDGYRDGCSAKRLDALGSFTADRRLFFWLYPQFFIPIAGDFFGAQEQEQEYLPDCC